MTFTTTTPTKPGAYWWKRTPQDSPCLLQVLNDEYGMHVVGIQKSVPTGEWCRLVPAEEVKKAYDEGWHNGATGRDGIVLDYADSRARRMVEGLES